MTLILAPEHGQALPLIAAHWRVGGLLKVDALPPGPRLPPLRLQPPLVAAWPWLSALPEPLEAVVARYPCPPPAHPWLASGLALAGVGLGGIAAGELLENRMMATEGEDRARRLYHLGVASSFTGLALTVGGLGVVAEASLRACREL